MRDDVEPVSDTVFRRPLPSLQSIAMGEIVCGLPEVECLITVLDRIEQGRHQGCCKEKPKGMNWLNNEVTWGPVDRVSLWSLKKGMTFLGTYFFLACEASGWTK